VVADLAAWPREERDDAHLPQLHAVLASPFLSTPFANLVLWRTVVAASLGLLVPTTLALRSGY
jgi:hypothetical protein